MAKAHKTHKITTPRYREKLPVSRNPYFVKTSPGKSIGYLKTGRVEKWLARTHIGGKYKTTVIGNVSEIDYSEALAAAVKIFGDARATDMVYTVDTAIAAYIEHLKASKSNARVPKDAAGRLAKHVPLKIRKKALSGLTASTMFAWKDSLVVSDRPDDITDIEWEVKRNKSRNTANRTLSQFKAALNLAYKKGHITSDKAWKSVNAFAEVDAGRPDKPTPEQIATLLANADGQLKNLVLAGIYTGARYGELASAKVTDFNPGIDNKGKLKLSSRKGKGGAKRQRDVILSKTATEFFKGIANGSEYLLVKDDGSHWRTGDQRRPMERLIKKAGLPKTIVFYALRHYHITQSINGEVPIFTVAKNCGTSVKMIEKTYGAVEDTAAREAFDGVALV